MLPLLTPWLLIGYAYNNPLLHLLDFPWVRSLIYNLLVICKLAPVATLLYTYGSGTEEGSASFLRRSQSLACSVRLRLWLAAEGRLWFVAWSLITLLTLQEFELASLLTIERWTVQLFDAHASGISLSASLGTALPAACVMLPLCWPLLRKPWHSPKQLLNTRPVRSWWPAAICTCVATLYPLAFAMSEVARALPHLSVPGLGPLLWRASWVSALSACMACLLTRWTRGPLAALFLVPALLGGLVAGLLILPLHSAGQTSLPKLIFGLVLHAFPVALAIRLVLNRQQTARHTLHALPFSRRLRASARIYGRTELIGLWLVFCWTFQNLTTWALLAPIGFDGFFVRLHNLLHYGHNQANAAMLVTATLSPLILLAGCCLWTRPRESPAPQHES